MGQGLECYDANGVLKFTAADRLGRFLTTITIGTSAGSTTVLGINTGEPFAVVASRDTTVSGFQIPPVPPTVTFDTIAQSVSWGSSSYSPGWVLTIGVR